MFCLICYESAQFQYVEFESDFIPELCDLLTFDISHDLLSLNISIKNLFCVNCFEELKDIFEINSQLKLLQKRIENFKSSFKTKIFASDKKRLNNVNEYVTFHEEIQKYDEIRTKICKGFSSFPHDPIVIESDKGSMQNHSLNSQSTELGTITIKNEEEDDGGDDEFFSKELDFNAVAEFDGDNTEDAFLEFTKSIQTPETHNQSHMDALKEQVEQQKAEAKQNDVKIKIKRLEDMTDPEIQFKQIASSMCSTESTSFESKLKRFAKLPKENDGRIKCVMCDIRFSTKKNYRSHMKIHQCEGGMKCTVCERIFKTTMQLNEHFRYFHIGEKNFHCFFCKRLFSTGNNLNSHMRLHTGEKPYKCDICKKTFYTSGVLNKHTKLHSQQNSGQMSQVTSNESEKIYQCNYCQKLYFRPKSFKEHLRIHTGEKPYKCQLCEETFITKYYMDQHVLAVHPESAEKCKVDKYDQIVSCEICHKTMKLRNFKEHMMRHTGMKNFACEICGKTFVKAFVLKVHLRSHTGEKPLNCEVCNRAFTTKQTLIQHSVIHSNERKYQCTVCGKTFAQSGTLQAHSVVHSDERNFTCTICGMSFKRRVYLNNHMNSHTGEKSFLCPLCGMSFAYKSCLFKHQRKQHPKV